MPIHNGFTFIADPSDPSKRSIGPQGLRALGPLLMVEVGIPSALADQLGRLQQPVPSPTVGPALIDTGASASCIDEAIARSLNLSPVAQAQVHTPGGPVTQNVYAVRFAFVGTNFGPIDPIPVLGASLGFQQISALIGRDILSICVLVYNGPGGHYSLSS